MSVITTNQFAEGDQKNFLLLGAESPILTLGKTDGKYWAALSTMFGQRFSWESRGGDVYLFWELVPNVSAEARIPSYVVQPAPTNV